MGTLGAHHCVAQELAGSGTPGIPLGSCLCCPQPSAPPQGCSTMLWASRSTGFGWSWLQGSRWPQAQLGTRAGLASV